MVIGQTHNALPCSITREMVLINYNYKLTDQVDTWSVGFYVAEYVKLSLEFDPRHNTCDEGQKDVCI